jgi:hypothetical protein
MSIPTSAGRRLSGGRATALALCLAAAAGCGGQSPVGPRLDTVVVFQHEADFSNLARFGLFATDFEVPQSGTLKVTVDWTSATDDLDLVLTNPACDSTALAAGLCKVLATDESNAKPATVSLATGPTAYRVIVVNRGPGTESGTVGATVTQTQIVQ